MLNRKLLRDLLRHRGQVAGVVLIIILVVAALSGLLPLRQLLRMDLASVTKEQIG